MTAGTHYKDPAPGEVENYLLSKGFRIYDKERGNEEFNFIVDCCFCGKTKHLSVGETTGRYKCWVCGITGNLYILKKHFGDGGIFTPSISVPATPKKSYAEELSENFQRADRDQPIWQAAKTFFQDRLLRNKEAIHYWENRGITLETLQSHEVGYWGKGLYEYLSAVMPAEQASEEKLEQAGLFKKNGKLKTKYHNFFVFPVYLGNRIVNLRFKPAPWAKWKSRTGEVITPKTMGIAGQIVFLYLSDLLKKGLKFVVICEGEPDTLTLIQAGIPAVGIPGAGNFKREWVDMFNGVEMIFAALDPDRAGENGFENIRLKFKAAGREVYKIELPAGKDVNDFFQSFDSGEAAKNSFLELMERAKERAISREAPAPQPAAEEFEEETESYYPPEEVSEFFEAAPEPEEQDEGLQEIFFRIGTPDSREITIIESATGTGKTHEITEAAIRIFRAGGQATIFTHTVHEARNYHQFIHASNSMADLSEKEKSAVIGLYTSEGITGEKIDEELKPIAISTFGYLGLRGETEHLFAIARKLITENRIVFVDESHSLFQKCQFNESLAGKYFYTPGRSEDEECHYRRRGRCPLLAPNEKNTINTKEREQEIQETCKNCLNCYNWRSPTEGRSYKRGYFAREISTVDLKREPEGLPEVLIPFAKGEGEYIQIGEDSTLYAAPLPAQIKPLKDISLLYPPEGNKTKEEPNRKKYLGTLLPFVYLPCMKIEKTIEMTELKDTIKVPSSPCQIPILSGVDSIPFRQVMKARQVIFTSATMPAEAIRLIKEIAAENGQEIEHYKNGEIPFTFDVTLLKTSAEFHSHSIAKIAAEVKKTNPEKRLFAVAATKTKAETLFRELAKLPEGIQHTLYFYEEDYKGVFTRRIGQKTTEDILLTYARSAIAKGENMPERTLCIVDCSQFIPQAAIGGILQEPETPIIEHQQRIIQENVTQIVGRLFRSELERIPGQTIEDHSKRIVIFLHGIPINRETKTPIPLELDRNLITQETYREYTGSQFISGTEKSPTNSIIKNIILALNGEEIPNQAEVDKQKVKEKSKENITPRKRKIYAAELQQGKEKRKQARQAAKEETLKERVMAAATAGESWSEVFVRLHIGRLTEAERKELRSWYILKKEFTPLL